MSPARPISIPLPCALLALSVAVCLGAAGPVEASTLRAAAGTQAEQRQSLEHLLEAIQQAAKKLTDRLDSQAAYTRDDTNRFTTLASDDAAPTTARSASSIPPLREALLNLPPPSC